MKPKTPQRSAPRRYMGRRESACFLLLSGFALTLVTAHIEDQILYWISATVAAFLFYGGIVAFRDSRKHN